MISLLLALMCSCSECICEEPPETPPYHESCQGPQSYTGGSVWKPRSDSDGNLVILMRNTYPIFDFCEVKLRDGSYEQLRDRGLSNPDRQTYGGSRPGGMYYAGKMKDGGHRCFIGEEVCEWLIPGAPKNRHD